MKPIQVDFATVHTSYGIQKTLKTLKEFSLLSFDIETKGIYSRQERAEAIQLLKDNDLDQYNKKLAYLVSNNSGLSFPTLIQTTHFIFGTSKDTSIVLIAYTSHEELLIWNWLKQYEGKLLIHNTLFDLKVMHHRVGTFPKDYEDTALMAKTLINNAENWKARIGLKELMGSYYDPAWTLIDEYEPENLQDPKFLRYAAIDGAATYYLYELLLENE